MTTQNEMITHQNILPNTKLNESQEVEVEK